MSDSSEESFDDPMTFKNVTAKLLNESGHELF